MGGGVGVGVEGAAAAGSGKSSERNKEAKCLRSAARRARREEC